MSTEYEVNDIVDPYGKQRNIKLVKSPIIGDSGEVEFIVGLVQDTTEHRRLDKARLDFIRIAAHELRTPLTSMKLGFELLARETRGSLNADQQRSFDILSISIERLSSLAKNLLDLASLDAGVLTMNQQTVALVPLMDEAVALFSSTIGEKELYCKVEVADEIRNAHADPGRISQVLYNLVSNAVKYTSEGGITLSARDPGDGFLEVCVSDTGTGISASHCKSIFTSFVKAQDSETAREGTGLGLSITKAIVEAHGGNIWVESTPGAGSSFYFTVLVEGSELQIPPVSS
jgi:signal transduction histidine kinase